VSRGADGDVTGRYRHPAARGWEVPYASWLRRAAALLVDLVLLWPFDLAVGLLLANVDDPDIGGLAGTAVYFVAFCFLVWNLVIRQGRTGRTIGKQLLGIRLLAEDSGHPVGSWTALVRELAHVLDLLPCYLGFLWPVWDAKRQTFADKVIGTVVVVQQGETLPH